MESVVLLVFHMRGIKYTVEVTARKQKRESHLHTIVNKVNQMVLTILSTSMLHPK